MPGQFINTGTNPGGKLSLVNNNNVGNLVLSVATAPPALILYLSPFSSGDACAQTGPIYPITGITFNGGTGLCDSTSLDSNDLINIAGNTTYYATDGTNVRPAFKVGGGGIILITFTGPCVSC